MNRRHFLATAAAGLALRADAALPDRKLRVAVVGHTGRGDYGHGLDTMWLALPEVEIAAVADANPAGLAAALQKLRVSDGFADYRQMLQRVQPDLVAICMRHVDQHCDAALAAVEAGARGIYIEKPFCRTPAEADAIVAACEAKQTRLAIAHRNRYHPVLPVIARWIEDGGLGRLLEVRARGKEDPRGGALDLYVLGSHLLNLVHYFCGSPLACTATVLVDGRPLEKADVKDGAEGIGPLAGNEVHARYETHRGVPVFFDSVHDAGSKAAGFGLQLLGTEGIVDIRADQEALAHFLPGNPFRPHKEPRAWIAISTAGVGKPEPMTDVSRQVMSHALAGRDLVAAVRDNRQPLCDVYQGRTVMEMIAAVFESHRQGGRRVTFPLATRQNPLALL